MRDVEYRDLIDELNIFASGTNEASSFEDKLYGIYKLLAEMTRSESTIEAVRYVIPSIGNYGVQALTMI